MKVTFIKPNFTSSRSGDAMEPLAFAVLSALTPRGVTRVLYDERVETVPLEERTDLVALSVETFTAKRAYAIAARYRARTVPVVMGGIHPTLLPDEAALHADAVVIGDAETVWPRLLEDFRSGKLAKMYTGGNQVPLTGIVFDRTIFQGKKYLPIACVQFGRGCRYACEFCSVHSLYGNTRRLRPVEEVVSEIEHLGSRWLMFVDDSLFLDVDAAKELLERMIPLRVRWVCQVSIECARDAGLLALMRRSGCIGAFIGLESLEPASLGQMKKSQNLHLDYTRALARFRENGILVCGSFVFGYDADTPASVQDALNFALSNRLCLAHFNALFPAPGTRLYDRLRRERRIRFDSWWLDEDFHYGDCCFAPRGMSTGDLERAVLEARRRFNTLGSLLHRALDLKANARGPVRLVLFLAANLVN
ncbi:MAG TPA: radical SAM protein, partial [Spirochaetia bacterium]|nr:radical SAM protein [Spirochaetia bacterium]